MKQVEITTEYITLGQFLKFSGIIRSGSMAKAFILAHDIYVNGEREDRRGRKLYKGYKIVLDNQEYEII